MNTEVKERVRLASEIEPELNRILANRRIERVEWHDGHGDSLTLHLDDGQILTVQPSLAKAHQLFLVHEPDPQK